MTGHTMSPGDLDRIGCDLYGPRWKAQLARVLGISRETVSRYANSAEPMPALFAWAVFGLAAAAARKRGAPLPAADAEP